MLARVCVRWTYARRTHVSKPVLTMVSTTYASVAQATQVGRSYTETSTVSYSRKLVAFTGKVKGYSVTNKPVAVSHSSNRVGRIKEVIWSTLGQLSRPTVMGDRLRTDETLNCM